MVYDPESQSSYAIEGRSYSTMGRNIEAVIEVARTLFDGPSVSLVSDDRPLPSTTLRYDTYDTTAAVATAGSYAFLRDTEDLSSAADTHGALLNATGIIVNVADDGGISRATFYDGIKVGDVVEWVPIADEKCWQRYRVRAILQDPAGSPSRRLFALDHLPEPIIECDGSLVADGGTLATELRWNPPAARLGRDGIPIMLRDQPVAGGATYRAATFTTIVIDVPAGMSLVRVTGNLLADGHWLLGLEDLESGSWLTLDLLTGEELAREIIESSRDRRRDVGALFDRIAASARIVLAPPPDSPCADSNTGDHETNKALVPGEGVEPSRLSAAGFKPAASAIPPPRQV